MRKVHIMLQAKGGVGKSTCVAIFAQYLKDHLGRPPFCLDTDPSNQTFTAWRSFGAKHIDIAVDGDLEKARFDLVVDQILSSDRDVVVDTGSGGFIPITSYMAANNLPRTLHRKGCALILHTVIVAGQPYQDTLSAMQFVAETFKGPPVVVWLNPVNGRIDRAAFDQEVAKFGLTDRVTVVELPNYGGAQASTFGRDFTSLLKDCMTFKEGRVARASETMVESRFEMMEEEIFAELDEVFGAAEMA